MPRISVIRSCAAATALWIILGLITGVCIFILFDPVGDSKTGEYHTTFRQILQNPEQVSTEEYVTLNQQTFALTEIRHSANASRYETIYSKVISAHEHGGQLQIQNITTDHTAPWVPYEKNAELFARHQYASQIGAILNYAVLTAPTDDAFCLYIYEVSRLRCLHP